MYIINIFWVHQFLDTIENKTIIEKDGQMVELIQYEQTAKFSKVGQYATYGMVHNGNYVITFRHDGYLSSPGDTLDVSWKIIRTWNSVDELYLSVWHQNIVFNDFNNFLVGGRIGTNAFKIIATEINVAGGIVSTDTVITVADTADFPPSGTIYIARVGVAPGVLGNYITYTGKTATTFTGVSGIIAVGHPDNALVTMGATIGLGDPLAGSMLYIGDETVFTTTAAGVPPVQFDSFNPSVAYNWNDNQFLCIFSSGKWEVSSGVDDDGDGMIDEADPDFIDHGVIDPFVFDTDPEFEFARTQNVVPPNSRVVATRIIVDSGSLAVTLQDQAAPIELSAAPGALPGDPGGLPLYPHPSVMPKVSWDTVQWVAVWSSLSGRFYTPEFEQLPGGSDDEIVHHYWAQKQVRMGLIRNPVAAAPLVIPPREMSKWMPLFVVHGSVGAGAESSPSTPP